MLLIFSGATWKCWLCASHAEIWVLDANYNFVFICETTKDSLSRQALANNRYFGLIQWFCNERMASICIFEWRVNVAWVNSQSSWVLQTLLRQSSLNSWVVKLFISVRNEFAYSRAECVMNTDKVWRSPILQRMLFVLLECNTSLVMYCGSMENHTQARDLPL